MTILSEYAELMMKHGADSEVAVAFLKLHTGNEEFAKLAEVAYWLRKEIERLLPFNAPAVKRICKNGLVKVKDGSIFYEATIGSNITNVAAECSYLASETGWTVKFEFNGTNNTVKPGDSPETIEAGFMAAIEQSRLDYANSPEGKLREQQRQQEIAARQKCANELINSLPDVLADLDKLLSWLTAWMDATDDVGVKVDQVEVASKLESVWKCNAHVGKDKSEFTNKKVMGEYLVGQAISCMQNGMPPHPVLKKFVETYNGLPS